VKAEAKYVVEQALLLRGNCGRAYAGGFSWANAESDIRG
jgi:hypothetical protein